MKLLCVLSFIILINYSASNSIEFLELDDVNCMIAYLKSVNELDQNVAEVGKGGTDCKTYLDSTLNTINEEGLKEIEDNNNLNGDQKECLRNKWKESNIDDLKLTHGWLKVVQFSLSLPLDEKIAKYKTYIDEETKRMLNSCGFNIIDENQENSSPYPAQETEYCIKMYLIEHGYIDTAVHKIDLNYPDIDTNKADCKSIIEMITKQFEKETIANANEGEVECTLEVYREENFMWKSLVLAILNEAKLGNSAEGAEVIKFLIFTADVHRKIKECKNKN